MKLRGLLIFAAVVYLSWLAMQAVHELGHVLAATVTGGSVVRVVLSPIAISRTDVSPNPSPLAVAWGGPLVGVAIPVLITAAFRFRRRPARSSDSPRQTGASERATDLADFFAGFCLIANGVYIGVGSFDRVGDAGDLLRHGAPFWVLIAFGIVTIAGGLFCWHLALNRYRRR